MSGIYIHIPFCTTKCNYCNFFSVTSLSRKASFIEALEAEISLQSDFFKQLPGHTTVDTIYLGGGTPSLLTPEDLRRIFVSLSANFSWSPDVEITIEANPDDVTTALLREWLLLGINRLSIGIQSFRADVLRYLSRRHSAEKSLTVVEMALNSGFKNLSGDLIYGVPGLRDDEWLVDVERLSTSGVTHISAYALTVEPKTSLDFQIRKGRVGAPDEDAAFRQYYLLRERLRNRGFDQYEISNFSFKGYQSRHNSGYWSGEPYLGLGPSAHSYNGNMRRWNPSLLQAWIDSSLSGIPAHEEEFISMEKRYNEMVMTKLRTSVGLNMLEVEKSLGLSWRNYLEKVCQIPVKLGDVVILGETLFIPSEKLFLSDAIISDLMYVD
ncbi:MAG TPA: coproporphyrinogen III oxidase [Bacteroidales bacterium]|nr:MAG: hypothetical protein A2X11_05520 [Bacteroidetes bacterium GWE2_42_24]OFY30488.1 MAG: hypothetical protein A2X09_16505 [Bacteroidetes bacterium GWF2_43_11]HBZ67403.1 coproporphyrinogen III oxidase [Bacteroidales bacterium]